MKEQYAPGPVVPQTVEALQEIMALDAQVIYDQARTIMQLRAQVAELQLKMKQRKG